MNMDWVAFDPKHSNRTIHRAGVTWVRLTPTSLDWEAGQQVGMQQVTPDVPMLLSLTDDRLQEDEFISSKSEMSRELTRLRQQLAEAIADREAWHGDASSHLQALCEKQAEVNGLEQQIEIVTKELEACVWSITPAMAQEQIDQLNRQLAAAQARIEELERGHLKR